MATSPEARPFTAFNFSVEIRVPFMGKGALCSAAFQECDGLEMNSEIKTVREGGNNTRQIKMLGPVTYGALTLKRGMTDTFDLWEWFDALQHATPSQMRKQMRANVDVVMLPANPRGKETVRFILSNCLPTKLKAPALNGKEGGIAIEEMQLAYESMRLKAPGKG
jgi:phage tail-like protein